MYTLSTEQQQIQESARRLAQEVIAPRAAQHDIDQQYPWDNVKDLTDAGFMGRTIPREYGGQGLSFFDTVLVVDEMAGVCGGSGRVVVVGRGGAVASGG